MKINKANLMRKVRGFILFPALALAVLSLYSHTLYSSDIRSVLDENIEEIITVIGKVIDTDSEALDSVIIKDVNSDIETISDAEGKFTLSLKEPTMISFTKLGFEVMEMEIAESDSNLSVMLTPESNELIVEGFASDVNGNKNRNWLANSFISIIENNPLYIVDNAKKGSDYSVETLNPDDVMSIEVLTDTIAEELYGTEGERGAVIIMTKYFMPADSKVSKEMEEDEVILPTLKEKYEMYKDTMNARKERFRERYKKAPTSKTAMPLQSVLPIDSVNKSNDEVLDKKMEIPIDTASISIARDTTLIEAANDTTLMKMQMDTASIESKKDTIISVKDIK